MLFWETSPCADITASLWGLQWKLTSVQVSIYCIFHLWWYVFLLISLSLHLIKHYWSPSHHWHNFLTSIIKVNTQTRFMVLFTSRSSLTWGNLQVLCMLSPPGIYLLSTPNNRLFMSLHKLYDDWICIPCQQGRQVWATTWWLFGVISASAPAWTTWNSHIIPQGNYFPLVT